MATQQRRLLTAEKSRLGNADLPVSFPPLPHSLTLTHAANATQTLLRKPQAWETLPLATRSEIYALLPAPREGEPAHDVEVNPLKSAYRPFIEEGLRRWQADLKDGKETKKWRGEAVQAGRERAEGKFEEAKEGEREALWGMDGAVEGKESEMGDLVAPEPQGGNELARAHGLVLEKVGADEGAAENGKKAVEGGSGEAKTEADG